MPGERYVVLGLAPPRSPWFDELAIWAHAAIVPLEFVKCLAVEELRTRVASGRPFSAVVLDGSLTTVDRDLLAMIRDAGCAVFVVDDGRASRDWNRLGANAALSSDFGPDEMITALDAHAVMISRSEATRPVVGDGADGAAAVDEPARLIAVTGAGGTGVSTTAMAIAQGIATRRRFEQPVLLADFALDADLALLHDVGDVIPSVQELVDAHRSGVPTEATVRSLCFDIDDRSYHLLLGLRRHRDWTTVRPRAFSASLQSLRHAFGCVVADVTGDLEGEVDCGSIDVEERNVLARATTDEADVVVAVGLPGVNGLHRLVRVVWSLLDHGVASERVLPVINRAPRNPRRRFEISNAFTTLLRGETVGELHRPLFVGERRRLDDVIRDGGRLPAALLEPTVTAVLDLLDRLPVAVATSPGAAPVAVKPGSLGSWSDG